MNASSTAPLKTSALFQNTINTFSHSLGTHLKRTVTSNDRILTDRLISLFQIRLSSMYLIFDRVVLWTLAEFAFLGFAGMFICLKLWNWDRLKLRVLA